MHVDDLFLLLVLFQNAAQRLRHRERRTAPAARVSEVSLLQQDPV